MDPTLPSDRHERVAKPDADGIDARVVLGELREQMFGQRERPTVGRFEIIRLLGRGAHGSVYLARDEQLGRRVAVKVLRVESQSTARERLLREAHALARLKHPNVVTIHDVGVDDDAVFVAMEYVERGTLAQWCREHPPGTRARFLQLLRLAIGTARGLSAAHDAGIVHRDIKPANILVGADDRPRIADFGLARAVADIARESERSLAAGRLSEQLTLSRTGDVVGTPAYMAPEQFGGESNASSDQWSLCAALWEAAYGQRPFSGEAVDDLSMAVQHRPPPPPPHRSEVPAWWHEILARGLSPEPSARWPSVAALASALRTATARRRRRTVLLSGVGVGLVGLMATGGWQLDLARRRARCREDAAAIIRVWNADVQALVRDAFVGTKIQFAETSFEHAVPYFDAYVEHWQARYDALCIATEVDRVRSARLWAASQRCLEDRRGEFAALVEVLAEDPDATTVRRTVSAAAGLGRLEPCSDNGALRRGATHGEDDEATAQLRRRLSRARALLAAGRYADGLGIAEQLREATVEHPSVRLRLRVLLVAADLTFGTGALEEASHLFGEAFDEALAAGEHDLALRSAIDLVFVVGSDLQRHDEGLLWGRVARGLEAHLGAANDLRAASLRSNLGSVLRALGRYEQAEREHERALEIRKALLGPEHPAVANSYHSLGGVYDHQGRYSESERAYEESIAIYERTLGPGHPNIADVIINLGIVFRQQGRYAEAEAELDKALTILERALGADHPSVAEARGSLGDVYFRQGRYDEAEKAQAQSLAVLQRALGPQHPRVAHVHSGLGMVYHAQGDYTAAQQQLETALGILEASLGPDHADVGRSHSNLGNVHYTQGRYAQAVDAYHEALRVLEKALGPEHPSLAALHNNLGAVMSVQGRFAEAERAYERGLDIAEKTQGPHGSRVLTALDGLAEVRLELRRPGEAVEAAERALAIRDETDAQEIDVARAGFLLARALWDARADRQRAHDLAARARDAYRDAGEAHADDLAQLERWLAKHPRRR